MFISKSGIKMIEEFEGYRDVAYKCSANVATIGYGTTVYSNGQRVEMGQRITRLVAERELNSYIERNIYPKINKYTWLNQNQFDSLCSLLYNIGSIGNTLKIALESKNITQVKKAFMRYIYVKGKVNNGLKNRREKEIIPFLSSKRVQQYQEVNKLTPDGICGRKTKASFKVYKKGSKHKNVKLIQEWLGLTKDGKYGSITYSAVFEYQKRNGLKADGIVGSNTWQSLLGL